MDSEASQQNPFDRIPDDLLRLILDRVLDAKSLCACLAVSTRFNSLALHSTSLSLSVDRIHFDDEDSDPTAPKTNLLRSLLRFFISRPLRFFLNRLALRTDSTVPQAVFYSPTEALKSFSRIEVLKIQLPSHGELQLHPDTNSLLKWNANFGTELKTCVIIAGTSLDDIKRQNTDGDEERPSSILDTQTCGNKEERVTGEERGGRRTEPSFPISNEDLKARVVWTISCLIAASSRHHLLKRIVAQHPMLKSIEMVDEHRQGTLTMGEADISQMRATLCDSNPQDESSTDRTRIPALKMKMWHVPELELPGCGKVMRGATLVSIGAADNVAGDEEMFESVQREAAREIRRKVNQSYLLEMESF